MGRRTLFFQDPASSPNAWWLDPSLVWPQWQAEEPAANQAVSFGDQLSVVRQQNETARQWLALETARRFGLPEAPAMTPLALPEAQPVKPAAPPEAPGWMAPADTWLGQRQRKVFGPSGFNLGEALLTPFMALGGLAQGVEGLIGGITAGIPRIGAGRSLVDEAAEEARRLQQALGQDFTEKYRAKSGVFEKPFARTNDPATWAVYQARNIAYSGAASEPRANAQLRAVRRMLAGEDPTVAMRGMEWPGEGAYADELALWETRVREYMDAAERNARAEALQLNAPPDQRWGSVQAYADAMAKKAREDAGRWVNATKRIPGEEDPVVELVGQVVLDPLNLPGANLIQEKVLGRVIEAGKGITARAMQPLTVYDDSLKAAAQAITTGVSPRWQAMGETLRAKASAGNPVAKAINGLYQRGLKLVTYTPETQARVLTGTAYKQLGDLLSDAGTGAEASQRLALYLDDPKALTQTFGRVPVSVEAEVARPVVAELRGKLQALPSLQADEFNPAQFMKEVDEALVSAGERLAGVDRSKPLPAWQRWASAVKAWMSEFYLKTPGYIARNWMSDNAIATMDGLRMFENMQTVRRDLEQWGVLTRRVADATGIGGQIADAGGATSKLASVPLIGALQTKLGEIADAGEKARYTRAFWSALMDFWGTNWKPKLSEETRALLAGQGMSDLADDLEGVFSTAKSGKDIRRAFERVMNARHPVERFSAAQWLERADDLPFEMQAQMERELRDLYQNGGGAEDAARLLDIWKQRIEDDGRARLAQLGDLHSPRATTERDAAEDLFLEREQPYQSFINQRVKAGEISKEQGAQLVHEYQARLAGEDAELRRARAALREAMGGGDADDDVLAVAMWAVDGEQEVRDATRIATDKRRAAEWAKEPAARNWSAYFNEQDAAWGTAHRQAVERYQQAQQLINELRQAPDTAARAAALRQAGVMSMAERAEVALGRARVALEDAALLGDFDKALLPKRQAWDMARAESARQLGQMLRANPNLGQDGLDIFLSAQRDVQRRFDQAVARVEGFRAQMLSDKITLDEYRRLANEEWTAAFAYATDTHGRDLQTRLMRLETVRGQVAERLAAAGVPQDEIAQLMSGLRDGSTRAEVERLLRRPLGSQVEAVRTATGMPAGPAAMGAVAEGAALNPPPSADDWLRMVEPEAGADADALAEAVRRAREMEARAAQVSETAAQQWRAVGDDLAMRWDQARGLGVEEMAHRQLVRDMVRQQGLGTAADYIRQFTGADTVLNRVMREELGQIVRERAIDVLDGAEDMVAAYGQVQRMLEEALFGTVVDAPVGRMGDAARVITGSAQLAEARGIPAIKGLERERSVSMIRALSEELGLNGEEFTRGERGIAEVIAAARRTDAPLVDKVLTAPVVRQDGRIKAEAWPNLGIGGKRRTPGEVLRELAGQAPKQPPTPLEVVRTGETRQVSNLTTATGADPNQVYRFRVRVVSLDDVVPSHTDTLMVNPRYPEGLQPRMRSRAASEIQIDKIARNLAPDAVLMETRRIDQGVPIVGADLAVESGNGRVLALRRARQQYPEQWQQYQARMREVLPEYALTDADMAGIKDPVLVRERLTDVDRVQFATEANSSAVLGMSPAEQAAADAKLLSDQALQGLVIRDGQSVDQALLSPANKDVVHQFLSAIPDNERASLLTADGRLNQTGLTRIKAAMFARTYPGEAGQRLTNAFFESLDPGVKNIQAGMMASLPSMARATAQFASGVRDPALSIADDVAAAVDVLARLKQQQIKVADYVAQVAMFGDELTPNQKQLLAWLDGHSRSPKQMREFLQAYADEIDKLPPPSQGMLFAAEAPTKENILHALTGKQFEAEVGAVAATGDELAGTGRGVGVVGGDSAAMGDRLRESRRGGVETGGGSGTGGAGSADRLSGEAQADIDEHVAQHGNLEMPGIEAKVSAETRRQLEALEKVRAGVIGRWSASAPSPTARGVRAQLEAEMKEVVRQLYETRAAGINHAAARADFALLDYGAKRGFDTYLGAFAPFYYWGSRQARNFAIRFFEKPQYLVNYLRYRDGMQKVNRQRGYRQRFEGGIEVSLPGGRTSVLVDPLAVLFPFASMFGTNFDDAGESKTFLQQVYDAASALGIRPGPLVDLPLRYSNLLANAQPGTPEFERQSDAYGRGSIGNLIPQTGMIQAATALAGIGGPGGVHIERPLRQAAGLSETAPFEGYRVARSVRDMAVEAQQRALEETGSAQGFDTRPYLLAQAMIAGRQERGWSDLMATADVAGLAQEYGVSVPEAQAAVSIVRQAAQRAAAQQGVGTLASNILGLSVKLLPEGERLYGQMQQLERGAAYNATSGVGSRADVEAVRQALPALAVGKAQYATLPGDTSDPMSAYDSAQRAQTNAQFDALKDAVIRQRPWDRRAARVVEEGRKAALERIERRGQADSGGAYQETLAKILGTTVAAQADEYRPRSVRGANPDEVLQIRRDEAVRMVAESRPRIEQFATSGGIGVDFNKYKRAVAEWEASLQRAVVADPRIARVIAQAEVDQPGSGEKIREFLAGLTMDDVRAYWRRHDSPVEAAQNAYFDLVYAPALEAVHGKAALARGPAVDTAGLVDLVMRQYGDRWTRAELERELDGMRMPDVQTVARAQMSETARAKAEMRDRLIEAVRARFGERGVAALDAYELAETSDEKAAVRRRYGFMLSGVLKLRAEFNKQG